VHEDDVKGMKFLRAKWELIPNIALASWLVADIARIAIFAGDLSPRLPEALVLWAEVTVLAALALFVLLRPRPLREDRSPSAIAVALSGSVLPLGYGLLGLNAPLPAWALIAQAVAILLMAWSMLHLGRNFSILPQYRCIVAGGPYRVVRHPMYASYILFDGTMVLGAANIPGVLLWIAELVLLVRRAEYEERLLAASDIQYESYKHAVGDRLMPFVR
jgi:protein-S-isoprenylcysteine O-methyltransferase Ste14